MQIETEDIPIQTSKPQVEIDYSQEIPHRYMSPMYYISSRPQYQRSCGMSALITIFNYQFSTLGQGKLNPITVEEAYLKLNVIGTGSKTQSKTEAKSESIQSSKESLEDYLNKLDFGYFTYSDTILKWYRLLCRAYKVRGKCYYFYKKTGKYKTELQGDEVLKAMISKMTLETTQFIYRCYDHYFSPVGYEIIGNNDYSPFQNKPISQIFDNSQTTLIVAETAKRYAPFHILKWADVELDLSTYYPKFYDVRNLDKGIWTKKGAQNDEEGGSYHCIMAFEKQ